MGCLKGKKINAAYGGWGFSNPREATTEDNRGCEQPLRWDLRIPTHGFISLEEINAYGMTKKLLPIKLHQALRHKRTV